MIVAGSGALALGGASRSSRFGPMTPSVPASASTDGVIGPNLDDLLAPPSATAPDDQAAGPGRDQRGGGRMPKLSGQQADQVATFVAQGARVRSSYGTAVVGRDSARNEVIRRD